MAEPRAKRSARKKEIRKPSRDESTTGRRRRRESIRKLSEHFNIPSELRSREGKEQGMCPLNSKEKDTSYLRNESLYVMKV